MAGNGRRYTQEFKDSAIQLALNSEKSVIQLAKELGMSSKHSMAGYEIINKSTIYPIA